MNERVMVSQTAFAAQATLGLGTAALGNLYRRMDEPTAESIVLRGLAAGLTCIDTAPLYGFGLAEMRLGRSLAAAGRPAIRTSTKVGRVLVGDEGADLATLRGGFVSPFPFRTEFDYSRDAALRSLEGSLARLGVDRIDLALIHDVGRRTHGVDHPAVLRTAIDGAYRALMELREQGVVGAIGIGANEWEVCIEAMDRVPFDAFLVAGRWTLLDQSAGHDFLPRCLDEGVEVIAAGVHNSGILATGPNPEARFDYAPAGVPVQQRVRELAAVCERHGVSLAAVALRFPGRHPAIGSVLCGPASVDELEQAVSDWSRPIPEVLWDDLRDEGLLKV